MKHAFMIMAYNNWNQLKTLISLLDDSRNTIYVHIDAKSKDFSPSFFNNTVSHATLKFITRINVTWGGSSQIDCEISLLRNALESHSDYYHLLSGMDMPLHAMDYIDNYFRQHAGLEFIQFGQLGDSVDTQIRDRISTYHPFQNVLGRKMSKATSASEIIQRDLHIDRLRRYQGVLLGKGANWFSITDSFARYVISHWPEYSQMFTSSRCADELFLQTIVVNSPFKQNIYHPQADDDYDAIARLIEWNNGNLHTFMIDDYDKLAHSARLFARKFNEQVDNEIISAIKHHVQQEAC